MKKPTASQSAFLNLRAVVGLLLCFAGVTLAFFAFRTASAQPRTPSEQSGNSQPLVQAQFRGVLQVVKFDISPPLRDMKPLVAKECTLREIRRRAAARFRSDLSARLCRIRLCNGWLAPLEYKYRTPSFPSTATAICAAALRQTPTERSVPIMSSRWPTCIFKSLTRPGRSFRSGSEQYALVWIWWRLPDR